MARHARIEYSGAFYHVMARGNRREAIFVDPDGDNKRLFLQTLADACRRAKFQVWAWVLMDNQYHLVLKAPTIKLVEGMARLQSTCTRCFNRSLS